jgi:retron-type reverse transcriptase
LNSLEETYKLNQQLENGTYKARQIAKFTITKPKKREIISVCFRDRVYQRSLNDNALYPVMTKSFIRDNWACQKGKGTDYARDRMKVFLQKMYRKYGTDFYGLQCDIHGYYPNMRHDLTNKMLERKLEPEICKMAVDVLDSQYAGEIGYNPGSQMVQIVGISALDDHDHKIKEDLQVDEFGRYMDDSLLFDQSKEFLEGCKDEIEKLLASKGMEFNPKKTKVFSIKDGFTFLGFKYRLTDTGKVIMTIDPKNVKERRRRLRKLVNKAKRGEITKAKVDECYNAWKNHASKGNSFKLLQRMDKYYKELWR